MPTDPRPLVLVVDHDPAVAYAGRRLLGRKCRVETALRGLDAVARIRAGGVDAALLEVEMPESGGLSILDAIGEVRPMPRVLLMALSSSPGLRRMVSDGRAAALLLKPVDFALAAELITQRSPTARHVTEPLARNRGGVRPVPRPATPPTDARLRASELYLRGLRRLDQGRYDLGLQDLSSASDMAGSNPEYAAAQSRAHQMAAGHKAGGLARKAAQLALSQPAEALRLVEEALRLQPTRATHYLASARLLLQLGERLDLAEERLGTAIHLAPSDPTPRLLLAGVMERTGRYREALWALDPALALFPGDHEMRRSADRLRKRLSPGPHLGPIARRSSPTTSSRPAVTLATPYLEGLVDRVGPAVQGLGLVHGQPTDTEVLLALAGGVLALWMGAITATRIFSPASSAQSLGLAVIWGGLFLVVDAVAAVVGLQTEVQRLGMAVILLVAMSLAAQFVLSTTFGKGAMVVIAGLVFGGVSAVLLSLGLRLINAI